MSKQISIPRLPAPAIYELEYQYWPWGRLITMVEDWVVDKAPEGGVVADYMCGSGYLLSGIANRRPDLRLCGSSISEEEVAFGRRRRPAIDIECADSIKFAPPDAVDIAIATGGIHHLPPSQQSEFIAKVRRDMDTGGHFLVGEEVLPRFGDEVERRLGALRLGNALLSYVIERQSPDLVLEAAADVLKRDLFFSGDFKTSLPLLRTMLEIDFSIESCAKVWPEIETEYGDFFLVCCPLEEQGIQNEL